MNYCRILLPCCSSVFLCNYYYAGNLTYTLNSYSSESSAHNMNVESASSTGSIEIGLVNSKILSSAHNMEVETASSAGYEEIRFVN